MEMTLKRSPSNTKCTIGELDVDSVWECYTCEDVVRPVKIKGETAIPAGRYQVIVTMSNRFKRDLPLLLNVPNFEGVRIHTGNTAADTEGCILVGQDLGDMSVLNSKLAFAHIFPKIQSALHDGGEVWLTVKDA